MMTCDPIHNVGSRKAEFSDLAQGDGLVVPPSFFNMIGTLFPIAPYGRPSL